MYSQNLLKYRKSPQAGRTDSGPSQEVQIRNKRGTRKFRIFFKGLKKRTNPEMVHSSFSNFGKIFQLKFSFSKTSLKNMGHGIVCFEDSQVGQSLLETYSSIMIDGKRVDIMMFDETEKVTKVKCKKNQISLPEDYLQKPHFEKDIVKKGHSSEERFEFEQETAYFTIQYNSPQETDRVYSRGGNLIRSNHNINYLKREARVPFSRQTQEKKFHHAFHQNPKKDIQIPVFQYTQFSKPTSIHYIHPNLKLPYKSIRLNRCLEPKLPLNQIYHTETAQQNIGNFRNPLKVKPRNSLQYGHCSFLEDLIASLG